MFTPGPAIPTSIRRAAAPSPLTTSSPPFRTPHRSPSHSSAKRRRVDRVILTPITGHVAAGQRPDVNCLDSASKKVLAVLEEDEIPCDIWGIHEADVVTLDKLDSTYQPRLDDNIKQNTARYEFCKKAEDFAQGYNNACKENVNRIRAKWDEWETAVVVRRTEFQAGYNQAVVEQSNWERHEVKAREEASSSIKNRTKSELYSETLRGYATLPPHAKACANMSDEELQDHVGVKSVLEIKMMPPTTVIARMYDLKNNGIDANKVCENCNFYMSKTKGLKIRFSVYLGFSLPEIIDVFGLDDTSEVAAELFGRDNAKEMMEDASKAMAMSPRRKPCPKDLKIQELEAELAYLKGKK